MRPVLIFRRGSIGDAIVSIPALNEIARRHPGAQRWILSNSPVMEKAAAISEVLQHSTLVHGFINLPPGGGGWTGLRRASAEVRALGPDRLIYLSEPSPITGLLSEYAFFRMCGIGRIEGRPFAAATATYRRISPTLWESETARLLRTIGAANVIPDWRFDFLASERNEAGALLAGWSGRPRFILFSLGAKLADKEWGDRNWRDVLGRLTQVEPDLGILAIGAAGESSRTRDVLADWRGPVLDLCGRTSPRVSALVGEGALFYLGHDSGPMHLAALVGTPCVAVFSARAKPGVWFPRGDANRIFYPWAEEPKVAPRSGFRTAGGSISANRPGDVAAACLELLASRAPA